jgi:hypothetical protein
MCMSNWCRMRFSDASGAEQLTEVPVKKVQNFLLYHPCLKSFVIILSDCCCHDVMWNSHFIVIVFVMIIIFIMIIIFLMISIMVHVLIIYYFSNSYYIIIILFIIIILSTRNMLHYCYYYKCYYYYHKWVWFCYLCNANINQFTAVFAFLSRRFHSRYGRPGIPQYASHCHLNAIYFVDTLYFFTSTE